MTASRLKWYPPLDRLFGPVSEIELDRAISVRELLTRMQERQPGLGRYLRFAPEDTHARGLMILRGDKTLNLTDRIEPGDRVDILVGVQGGRQ